MLNVRRRDDAVAGLIEQHLGRRRARRRVRRTHDVYRIGSGPAVLVIHEVPGITPLVAAFGRKVAEHGMSAVLPDLFGTPGREPVGSYVVSSMARACVSREFTVFATNKTSPAVRYLRELASFEHERCGGPGVGAPG